MVRLGTKRRINYLLYIQTHLKYKNRQDKVKCKKKICKDKHKKTRVVILISDNIFPLVNNKEENFSMMEGPGQQEVKPILKVYAK